MKNVMVLALIVLIVIVLSLFLFSYQVRETEKALVLRFNKHVDTKEEPGWYFKWPKPIDKVIKYDSRLRLYERPMQETTTRDQVPIIVTSYLVWGVGDPLKFTQSKITIETARDHLYSLLGSAQNTAVANHSFSQFVNKDADNVKIDQIEAQILAEVSKTAGDYGIVVKTAGIKRLSINKDVTGEVFKRMKADRKRIADATLSEGEAQARKIRSDAEAKRTELLALVEAQAKSIRGQGDAEAASQYEKLQANPELAMFLRNIEALKEILKEKTTLVFGADTAPLKLLKEIPDIKPTE